VTEGIEAERLLISKLLPKQRLKNISMLLVVAEQKKKTNYISQAIEKQTLPVIK